MHLFDEPRPQTEGVHSDMTQWVAVRTADPEEVPEGIKDSVARLDEALSNKDWQKALNELLNQWLHASCVYTAATTDLKELNFLRTKVETEGGGEYVMAFLHLGGPKIQLRGEKPDGLKEQV